MGAAGRRGPRASPRAAAVLLALALTLAAHALGGVLAQVEVDEVGEVGQISIGCSSYRRGMGRGARQAKKLCRQSTSCRWSPEGVCVVAKNKCDAVQGKRLRRKCRRVHPLGSALCQCSLNPSKKRGKCGSCVESLDVGDPKPTPDTPRPMVGIIEDPKHLLTALGNFVTILEGDNNVAKALLPGILALPFQGTKMPDNCVGTECKEAVAKVISAVKAAPGHPDLGFALFDTENMDSSATVTRDQVNAILGDYGLKAADMQALILEGTQNGLEKYAAFKGQIGFVNEATKYNPSGGKMKEFCKQGWIFAATYTDSCGKYLKLPQLNSVGNDCYCNENINALAQGLLAQKSLQCISDTTCESTWPLLLSFETCTDCFMYHNPLLGYGPDGGGGSPASASPASLKTLMEGLNSTPNAGPVAIYKVEFYFKRLLGLNQGFEAGCQGSDGGPAATSCNSLTSTCEVKEPDSCPQPRAGGIPYCEKPKKTNNLTAP